MAANEFFDAIHPAADWFPMMPEAELRELGENIKEHFLLHRLVVWDDGTKKWLVDGRNRVAAMELVGIAIGKQHVQTIVAARTLGADPYDLVLSLNVRRRHLTSAQKRELIEKVLKARPNRSDRATAKAVGVDHKTVAAARTDLEATGEIPQLPDRVDTRGATRASKPKAACARRDDDESLDAIPTGQIINGLPVKKVVERPEKVRVVVLRWMRGADEDLHKIVNRLGWWEKNDKHVHIDLLADDLQGFATGLRKTADAIEHAIAQPSAAGADLWADLSTAPNGAVPEPTKCAYTVGDAVEFHEAEGKRWQSAKVTKILDDGNVEILLTNGNHRTPKLDLLRKVKRKAAAS
jgi:hypothetical protein